MKNNKILFFLRKSGSAWLLAYFIKPAYPIAPEGSGRSVKLIDANKREASNHIFYDLEYELNLNDQDRHELATVVIDRGTLYTFAVGTNEERWNKVDSMFTNVIESFNFLI